MYAHDVIFPAPTNQVCIGGGYLKNLRREISEKKHTFFG